MRNSKYENFIEEYQNQNKEKKEIVIKGERSNNKLYSNPEINELSKTISSFNYKNEIINTVDSLLNDGVNKRDIYVMSESVSLTNQYTNYGKYGTVDLNTDSGIERFYNLGLPISMQNDLQNMFLNLSFSLYRNAYKYFNNRKISNDNYTTVPNKKKTLSRIYNLIKNINRNFSSDIIYIISDEIRLANNPYEVENLINNWKENNYYINKINRLLSIYFESKNEENFQERLKESNISFQKFSNVFKNNSRPIVCFIDDNDMKILCFDMIASSYFTHDNYRFMETNMIRQQSPLLMCFGVALTFSLGFARYLYYLISLKTKQINHLEEEDKLDNAVSKREEKSNEISQKREELIKEREELQKQVDEIKNQAKNVPNDVHDTPETKEMKNSLTKSFYEKTSGVNVHFKN